MDKRLRRFIHFVGCGAMLLAFGCVNLQEIGNSLSEEGDYHFRKTRWGYSQAMVELSEQKQGTRLFHRKGNTLVYNERISDMPVKLVYCFENDRLRVAGYLTERPVKNAMEILKHAAETLGEPIDMISDGMVWADYHTLVYINGYVSHVTQSPARYQRSQGLLKLLHKIPKEEAGTVLRWDGIWTYVDQNFFRQLHEVPYPLDELSTYEKRLFAILKRQQMRTYITPQGRITLPSNP